jgi:hypothetical protein
MSRPAVLERESKWREDEIVMKWPHDFRGKRVPPSPGRYEAECTVFVLDDAGTLVQVPLVRLEFRRD